MNEENTGANIAPQEDAPTEDIVEQVEQNVDAELMAGGPPDPEPEKFTIVVDGEEVQVDLETLKKGYSHNAAAGKRMTEAQKLQKDAQTLLDLLKEDPNQVRKALDPDFDEEKFLAARLAAIMDRKMETPEEKQAREDAEELREYRERKKKEREETDNMALQEQMNQEIQKLDLEFAEAMKEVGLPFTDSARKRLANAMLEAVEAQLDIPTKTLAAQVKKDMQDELKELMKSADDDTFEALLGSDLLTKAQKLSLKKVKTPGNRTQPQQREPRSEQAPKKPRTKEDFLGELGIF